MELTFSTDLARGYTSTSQQIRICSEDWVSKNIFCPNCGFVSIKKYSNNNPASDFYCEHCSENYELKSKKNLVGTKIVDGAYRTMIESLKSASSPNFFLLTYQASTFRIKNFLVIPKHFFIPSMIEKRTPLSSSARRAGWIGCNILLNSIPESGQIFLVKNSLVESKKEVLKNWERTLFLKEQKEPDTKGWILDIMKCIEVLKKQSFSLDDIYIFEHQLSKKYPNNKHIKDKIRQQLQILRDKGYLQFHGKGYYQLN